MKPVHYLTTGVVAGVVTAALIISAAGGQDQSPTFGSPVGEGGDASTFFPPAHVDGPFGAGGPLAGIGGAGAFIPPAHVDGPFGAGGPLAGIGGAGAFIPSAELVASIQERLLG
jgi:hypothetical protein